MFGFARTRFYSGTYKAKQLMIIVDQISLLMRNIDFYPNIIMGHSAGAAVAYELAKKLKQNQIQ